MRPVSDAFNAAVRQPHQRAARVTLLDTDLVVTGELTGTDATAIEGSVTIGSDRRRSCSLRLVNPAGTLTPAAAGDALFPNALIRIERGIVIDGVPELVSLGVFVIDRPEIDVDPPGSTITISGQDRIKLALKSKFTVPTTYAAGEAIADVVRSIAQAAGMGTALYRLNDGGKSLAADRTYETGADRWPSIIALATDYALRAYVDADGYLVLEPAPTDATLPDPVWVFERGSEAIMLGITKGFGDDRLYNHVLVSGEAFDQAPLAAEARDLNPASPAYNPVEGTGPIGDRLYTYTSPMIRSIEQAAEVAAALLLEVALIEEDIRLPSVVHPALEPGDAVVIREDISRTSDTYLIDNLAIPLAVGPMTTGTKKLRDLRGAA